MRTLGIGKLILVGLVLGMLTPLFALSAPPEIKDSDTTAAIQKRLLADWWVRSNLDVETKGGVVKLSGTVDNLLANERAVEIAKSTKGVRAVVDMINVMVIDSYVYKYILLKKPNLTIYLYLWFFFIFC